jgi:ABC-type multidrug transport system fused ATPase/permease subunit
MPRVDAGALRSIWRRFGPLVLRRKRPLALAVVATLAVSAMHLLQPFPIKLLFDVVLIPAEGKGAEWLSSMARESPMRATLLICSGFVLIATLRALSESWQTLLIAFNGQRIVSDIRVQLYRHLQKLTPSFHTKSRTGDLVVRLTGDIAMMRELLVASTVEGTSHWVTLVGMTAIMLWYDPLLTLVAAAVIPVLVIVSLRYSVKIRSATKRQRRKESDIASAAEEMLVGIHDLQAFRREEYDSQHFKQANRSSLKAGLRSARLQVSLNRRVQVVVGIGLAAVFLVGVQRVLEGQMTAGTLLLFQAYVTGMYRPIRRLAFFTSRASKAIACAERVIEVLERKPAIVDRPGAVNIGRAEGRIEIEGLSFGYDPGRPVLRDVNLSLAPGEIVALVGPSGAGKSTLLDLLLRFHDPQRGRILLDGRDIREVSLDSLRRQFAVIPQRATLFALSIHDNIAFGRPDASRDKVERAARKAQAMEFIERLPRGLDSRIGERGTGLSGGQRQRIAIARAYLLGAPVLLLDEPTVGLDAESARRVRKGLRKLLGKGSAIVADHHPSLLELADRVVCIEDGRVVEQGALDELLQAGGSTQRLFSEKGSSRSD